MRLGEPLQPGISPGIQPQTHHTRTAVSRCWALGREEQMVHPGRGKKCLVVEKGRWRKKSSFLEGDFYFHWLD